MPDKYIDSADKLALNLDYWKQCEFIPDCIPLYKAVSTINNPDRLFEARQDYPGRWVLCPVKSRGIQPAIFYTVAVWRWGSSPETGNFVPPGETAPAKLAESRVQTAPGSLCQFSYAFDTHHDRTLWNAQETFEKYIQTVPGFNKSKKLRRTWQDGSDTSSSVYVMSSQMFFKRTKFTSKKEAKVDYPLHPWIETASKTTPYFPNPERPAFLEPSNGVLVDMATCDPSHIRTGDVVWITFFVEYIIGLNNWSTTFTPYDIVRVASVAPDLVGDRQDADEEDDAPRKRLVPGQQILMEDGFVRTRAAPITLDDTVHVVHDANLTNEQTSAEVAVAAASAAVGIATEPAHTEGIEAGDTVNEIAFGPDDARMPWDDLIEIPPSPTLVATTPQDWVMTPTQPEDDFDAYLKYIDDEADDEAWTMCGLPAVPSETMPLPSSTVTLFPPPSPTMAYLSSPLREVTASPLVLSPSASSVGRVKKRTAGDMLLDGEDDSTDRFAGRVTRSRRAVGMGRVA